MCLVFGYRRVFSSAYMACFWGVWCVYRDNSQMGACYGCCYGRWGVSRARCNALTCTVTGITGITGCGDNPWGSCLPVPVILPEPAKGEAREAAAARWVEYFAVEAKKRIDEGRMRSHQSRRGEELGIANLQEPSSTSNDKAAEMFNVSPPFAYSSSPLSVRYSETFPHLPTTLNLVRTGRLTEWVGVCIPAQRSNLTFCKQKVRSSILLCSTDKTAGKSHFLQIREGGFTCASPLSVRYGNTDGLIYPRSHGI